MQSGRPRLRKAFFVALAVAGIVLVSALGYIYLRVPIPLMRPVRNLVGVIRIEGAILWAEDAGKITSAINRAVSNASIKAVVLRIDSPGGYADLIEQVYLDILELKRKKPVVAATVQALSGGYYVAVAADYIYTHPTAMVGNVGVIGIGPPTLLPSEVVMETGPYKATGFSKLLFPFNLTHALDNFASAVAQGRGGRLKLSSTELRRGLIYMGSEAVAAGLADAVGSLQKAAEHAAREGNIFEYDIVDLPSSPSYSFTAKGDGNVSRVEWRELTVETMNRLYPPPALYYLYLPPGASRGGAALEFDQGVRGTRATAGIGGRGTVLVDLSHQNLVSIWELDLLAAELAKRNLTLVFADTWQKLSSALGNASGLVVANPAAPYSEAEFEKVRSFVSSGRALLLFFDPAWEYQEFPALFGPVNSLANRFGLSFAKGYLYNERESYGFYRNIYLRRFNATSLTDGLDAAVLFTATYIHSSGRGVAWATEGTYSSTAERMDRYAPVALLEEGNGTIAAFGDITFLREPYVHVEDNYRLLLNIVGALARVNVTAPATPEEKEPAVTKPDLSVGTEKVFSERVDGKEQRLRWRRTTEREVRIERENRTTVYRFDAEGSLLGWVSDGVEVAYDDPIPEEPYPLTKGKSWTFASEYNLTIDGEALRGRFSGRDEVEALEEVEAANRTYLAARIAVSEIDTFTRLERNITLATKGYLWVSSEAGLVKAEYSTRYHLDGRLAEEETTKLLLLSIKKGEG